jgi:hypothetical protein
VGLEVIQQGGGCCARADPAFTTSSPLPRRSNSRSSPGRGIQPTSTPTTESTSPARHRRTSASGPRRRT